MASRDEFLSRVAAASRQGAAFRPHLEPIPEGIGYLGAGEDLVSRFVAEVTAVGGEAFVVDNAESARDRLKQLLKDVQATSALCWRHEALERIDLRSLLAELRVTPVGCDELAASDEESRKRTILGCDVGITSCDLAIAETGSLMMCARPGQERVASLTPPVHIAVVERRQIVPDLIDAFDWLARSGADALPSNMTLITGPSKTGDIELQLTTGVHGPGKWRVIVIEESS